MRLFPFLRGGALAALLLTAWAGSAAAQNGRVGGLVKDEAGQPVKGATVSAEFINADMNTVAATTDEKGRFVMVGLRFGEWRFQAQAPGFRPQSGGMNVRTLGVNPPITFVLAKVFVAPSAIGSISPKDLQQSLAAADSLYDSQRWDEAIAAYRSILAQAPALGVVNLQIAAAYRAKKDFDRAIGAYREILKTDPDNDKAKVGIALASVERGDLDTAAQTLEAAARADGAPREVFYELGDVRLARAETDEAVKAYERAARLDPAWGKPAFALGRIAMAKGDQATARKDFEMVVDVDPTSPEASQATTMLQQLR